MKLLALLLSITAGAAYADEAVKINTDLRYRFEQIEVENKEARIRQRVRARLSVGKKVDEKLNIGLRLASGTLTDPVSTNQTLEGSFTNKPLTIDMAYFDYLLIDSLQVSGGKFANPFRSAGGNELLFDSDLTPEGLYLSYNMNMNPFVINATLANLQIEENSSAADQRLEGIQLNFLHDYSAFAWTFGLGLYSYVNMEGAATFVDPTNSFGNTVDTTTDTNGNVTGMTYQKDFQIQQVYFSLKLTVVLPVELHAEYVKNSAVDEDNTGNHIGLVFGQAKDPGSFQVGVAQRTVEKDAVVGAFTDSNFGGGGTDSKGIEVNGKYAVSKSTSVALTAFDNTAPIDNGAAYKRYQLDFAFKF